MTDRGNVIHAYHREGILVELNSALEETGMEPMVQFEHNFEELGLEEHLDVLSARINNLRWDLIELQELIKKHSKYKLLDTTTL